MVNKMISIFKPKKIKDFNPRGLNIYTFNAGFKKKDKDPNFKYARTSIFKHKKKLQKKF